jgi:hypothetical protein
MIPNFPFRHAVGLIVILFLLAVPLSAAWSAPGLPGLPPSSPEAPLGYLMHPEQQVSTPLSPNDPDRYTPASAYDSTNRRYLVVWHQTYASGHDREIYGQLVTPDGKKYGSPIVVSSGSHDRIQPAVAYNATNHEYLVVFMYDVNGDGKKYDLKGQRITAGGGVVGSPFTVITWENRTFWSPRITWNSMWNEYMIIWSALAQDTQVATDISMKCFDHLGTELWAWNVSSTGYPTNPDIAYDIPNDRYLLVWNYVNASGKNVVVGDLRDSEGDHKQAVDIFASNTNDALFPRVASGVGLFYLVTFEYVNSSTDHDIDIAWVTKDGALLYSTGLVTGGTNDTHPDVAGSTSRFEYMVTYQRADVTGAKIFMMPVSNWLPLASLEVCNYVFTDCILPSVSYGGSTFLNTYVIDLSTTAQAAGGPLTPVSVQHVFDRPFNANALYLPMVSKQ